MSYSKTSQWSTSWPKLRRKVSFCFFHNITKYRETSNALLPKRLTVKSGFGRRESPFLTTYRHRYSFIYATKPFALNSSTVWTRSNSNGKQPPSLGSIENEDAPLTKSQANDLVLRLTEDERKALLAALQEYNSNQVKAEYEAEQVPHPTGHQLINVALFNAVPFVGFGFLDNFIMISAGDYIDETLGSLITISTMAAAALGNTISDVMGIGSAWYIELAASKIGLKPPNLSPIQLDMKTARRAANLGRALGITVGCLLGMLPLLFISKEDMKKKKEEHVK